MALSWPFLETLLIKNPSAKLKTPPILELFLEKNFRKVLRYIYWLICQRKIQENVFSLDPNCVEVFQLLDVVVSTISTKPPVTASAHYNLLKIINVILMIINMCEI